MNSVSHRGDKQLEYEQEGTYVCMYLYVCVYIYIYIYVCIYILLNGLPKAVNIQSGNFGSVSERVSYLHLHTTGVL